MAPSTTRRIPRSFWWLFALSYQRVSAIRDVNSLTGASASLYEPSCCYACLSTLWSMELSCSDYTYESNDVFSITSPYCHSTNAQYLTSLAFCMQQKCAIDGVATRQIEQCWNNVAGDGGQVSSYESNLPQTTPAWQLEYAAQSLLYASRVNDSYYQDTKNTLISYTAGEADNFLYAIIMVIAVASSAILLGVLSVLQQKVLPWFMLSMWNKYLGLPALFRTRHSKSVFGVGMLPLRKHTIWLILYLGLNVALCSISYTRAENDTWYIGNKQLTAEISNRTGLLSIANLCLTIAFSGRNSLVAFLTQCTSTETAMFHRWTGRMTIAQGIVHGALYIANTDAYGKAFFSRAAAMNYIGCTQTYWTMGLLAMLLFACMFLLSILPVRASLYQVFVVTHILLAIASLVALWYHVSLRYHESRNYEIWLYTAFGIWGLDRLMRLYRLVALNYRLLFSRDSQAVVELLPGDEFLKITVHPSTNWTFAGGQRVFLSLSGLGVLGSTPLMVAGWNNGTEDATCLRKSSSFGTELDEKYTSTITPTEINDGNQTGSCNTVTSLQSPAKSATIGSTAGDVESTKTVVQANMAVPSRLSAFQSFSYESLRNGPAPVIQNSKHLRSISYDSFQFQAAPVVPRAKVSHIRAISHDAIFPTPRAPRRSAATLNDIHEDRISTQRLTPTTSTNSSKRATRSSTQSTSKTVSHRSYFDRSGRPSVTFIVRPTTAMTRHLYESVLVASQTTDPSTSRSRSIRIPILIEGPYESIPRGLLSADSIVAVASDDNITSLLGYLALYLSSFTSLTCPDFSSLADNSYTTTRQKLHKPHKTSASRFVLLWDVHDRAAASVMLALLPPIHVLRAHCVEVVVVCDGMQRGEGLDVEKRIAREQELVGDAGKVFVVTSSVDGDGKMADRVRAAVVDAQGLRGGMVDLWEVDRGGRS